MYAELSGEFSEDAYIYPSVIGSEHKVLHKADGPWSYNERMSQAKAKKKFALSFGGKSAKQSYAISTIGLYGRVYSRDPPYQQRPTGGINPL